MALGYGGSPVTINREGTRRIARAQPLHHRNRRIVGAAHREQNFEVGVVLLEERAQIFFQPVVDSGQRFEDADRVRCRAMARAAPPDTAPRRRWSGHSRPASPRPALAEARRALLHCNKRMKNIIVGTAGHIDHGKTALVKALTGIDADRLEEEKRRGITIDLGFAHLELTPALRLGFVDVPGHERFIKNMLAGVGGIDLVLFVVAADESIKPQTREHFDICRLLGIPPRHHRAHQGRPGG